MSEEGIAPESDSIEEAIQRYQRELEAAPNSVELRKKLAECLVQKGEYGRAEQLLLDALSIVGVSSPDPNLIDIYRGLFDVYIEQKRYSNALGCLSAIDKKRYLVLFKPGFGEDDFMAVRGEIDEDYMLMEELAIRVVGQGLKAQDSKMADL